MPELCMLSNIGKNELLKDVNNNSSYGDAEVRPPPLTG